MLIVEFHSISVGNFVCARFHLDEVHLLSLVIIPMVISFLLMCHLLKYEGNSH